MDNGGQCVLTASGFTDAEVACRQLGFSTCTQYTEQLKL